MKRHVMNWTEVEPQSFAGGVVKRALDLEGASLVTVHVPAGVEASKHEHAHEQFVQVLSGSGMLTTEQGPQAFGPGSVFVLPAHAWHSARFDTDTVLVETNLRTVERRSG